MTPIPCMTVSNNTKKNRRTLFTGVVVSAGLITGLSGCYHFSGNTTSGDVTSQSDIQKIAVIDSGSWYFDSLNHSSAVYKFYAKRQFIPAWWNHKRPSPQADTLFQIIQHSRYYGLMRDHYHAAELGRLFYDSAFENDDVIRRSDMLLTDAFVSIMRDLRFGRRSHLDTALRHSQHSMDSMAVAVLNASISRNEIRSFLEEQEPARDQYKYLRKAVKALIDTSSVELRTRLISSVVEDSTKESQQLSTIEVNLDRWRKETELSGRFIFVNIPDYSLELVEGDTVAFKSKVIVGSGKNQTPELDGLIRSFIIYPYWNVPRNIAVNEILPQAKRDSLYLRNHNYEILAPDGTVLNPDSIPWPSLHRNNFPYTFRQTQGLHNALGLVKFWFANPYAVYLHDTNARLLFSRKKRAISHGCVRVEHAMELGRFLLRDNEIVSPEDLDQYLEFEQQMAVKIKDIPIHIRYFTCMYRDGRLEFYDDVYGKDAADKKALFMAPVSPEKSVLVLSSAE